MDTNNNDVVVPASPINNIIRLLIFVKSQIPKNVANTEVNPFNVLAISAACILNPDSINT